MPKRFGLMGPRGWALLLLAVGCAACDSGSGDQSSPAVGAAFAGEAEAVCRDALDLKDAQSPLPFPDFNPSRPDPSKLRLIAPALSETVHTFETWLADMEALGEPPSGGAEWDHLMSAISDHVRIAIHQHAAAERADPDAFAEDYEEGSRTQDELLAVANAAGVPGCAEVDR